MKLDMTHFMESISSPVKTWFISMTMGIAQVPVQQDWLEIFEGVGGAVSAWALAVLNVLVLFNWLRNRIRKRGSEGSEKK